MAFSQWLINGGDPITTYIQWDDPPSNKQISFKGFSSEVLSEVLRYSSKRRAKGVVLVTSRVGASNFLNEWLIEPRKKNLLLSIILVG